MTVVIEGTIVHDTEKLQTERDTALQIRSNYFDRVVEDPEGIIEDAREALADVDFDTFVATGLSGATIAALLAHALGKNFLIIRKADDLSTHSSSRGVGKIGRKWVFLDDFICSGRTRRNVKEGLASLLDAEAKKGRWNDDYTEYVINGHHETEYVGDFYYLHNQSGPGEFFDADEAADLGYDD